MQKAKALGLLSISMKAGKVASGGFATEKAVRDGRAFLVILAEDASENTTKKFSDMCRYRDVPVEIYQTKETLGRAIGKDARSNLAILDERLAAGIREHIEAERKSAERSVL